MSEKLASLSERFPIEDVKQRRQGGVMLDYISIDATIRRLNEVLGLGWSFVIDSTSLLPQEGGKYLALVQGKIAIVEENKIASGIGADIAADPDKAIKTALAEALKKAGHQLGIGLYLWEESEREVVAKARKGQPKDGDKVRRDSSLAEESFSGGGSF